LCYLPEVFFRIPPPHCPHITESKNLFLLILLLTATELSLGGSSPYTSRDKTNKNKYTQTKQYKKHSTNNTKHSKYKYTHYQNTYTSTHITKTPTQVHINKTPGESSNIAFLEKGSFTKMVFQILIFQFSKINNKLQGTGISDVKRTLKTINSGSQNDVRQNILEKQTTFL
jgi:hypothetical protein